MSPIRSAIELGVNISLYLGPTLMKMEAGVIKAPDSQQEMCLDMCSLRSYDSAANLDDSAWAIKHWDYARVKEWCKEAKTGMKLCKSDCAGVDLPEKTMFDKSIDDYIHLFDAILAIMEYLQLSTHDAAQ